MPERTRTIWVEWEHVCLLTGKIQVVKNYYALKEGMWERTDRICWDCGAMARIKDKGECE